MTIFGFCSSEIPISSKRIDSIGLDYPRIINIQYPPLAGIIIDEKPVFSNNDWSILSETMERSFGLKWQVSLNFIFNNKIKNSRGKMKYYCYFGAVLIDAFKDFHWLHIMHGQKTLNSKTTPYIVCSTWGC